MCKPQNKMLLYNIQHIIKGEFSIEIGIYIDSITDCLIKNNTGAKYDTIYKLVTKKISKQVTLQEAQVLLS